MIHFRICKIGLDIKRILFKHGWSLLNQFHNSYFLVILIQNILKWALQHREKIGTNNRGRDFHGCQMSFKKHFAIIKHFIIVKLT